MQSYSNLYPYELRKLLESAWIQEDRTNDEITAIWRNTDSHYRLTKHDLIRYLDAHDKGIYVHLETKSEYLQRVKHESNKRKLQTENANSHPNNDINNRIIQMFRLGYGKQKRT